MKPWRRFDRRTTIDPVRLGEEKTSLVAAIRRDGSLDMWRVFSDATTKGALAELELDGVVQSRGPIGAGGNAPFRAASSNEERAQFRSERVLRDQHDYARHNGRQAASAAETEAHREQVAEWRRKIEKKSGRDA